MAEPNSLQVAANKLNQYNAGVRNSLDEVINKSLTGNISEAILLDMATDLDNQVIRDGNGNPSPGAAIRSQLLAMKSSVTQLSNDVAAKMEFYKVNLEESGGLHFVHYENGVSTTLNYADLAALYRDTTHFLYAEYRSITYIPSLPPDTDPDHTEDLLEFSAVWYYENACRISTIKINSANQIKATDYTDDFIVASKSDVDELRQQLQAALARITQLENK